MKKTPAKNKKKREELFSFAPHHIYHATNKMRAAVTAKVVSPTSTVFVAQVGEPPNIPRSDDRPHDRQDELGFGAPLSPLLGFLGRRNRASAILPLPDHRLQFGESWGFLCCFVFCPHGVASAARTGQSLPICPACTERASVMTLKRKRTKKKRGADATTASVTSQ